MVSGCVLQVCNTLPCELLEALEHNLGLLAAGTASRRRKRQTKGAGIKNLDHTGERAKYVEVQDT